MKDFLNVVNASQPKSWIYTLSAYLLAAALSNTLLGWPYAVGLVYFTLPYNLLLARPRKLTTWVINLPFLVVLGITRSYYLFAIAACLIFVAIAYSLGPWKLRKLPIADIASWSLVRAVGPFVVGLGLANTANFNVWVLIGLIAWSVGSYYYDQVTTSRLSLIGLLAYIICALLGLKAGVWLALILLIYVLVYVGSSSTKGPAPGAWLVNWAICTWLGWWLIWYKLAFASLLSAALLLLTTIYLTYSASQTHNYLGDSRDLVGLKSLDDSTQKAAGIGTNHLSALLNKGYKSIEAQYGSNIPDTLIGLSIAAVLLLPYLLLWQPLVLASQWAPILLLGAIIVPILAQSLRGSRAWLVIFYPILILVEAALLVTCSFNYYRHMQIVLNEPLKKDPGGLS